MSDMKKPPSRVTSQDLDQQYGQAHHMGDGETVQHSISAKKVLNLREAAAVLHCHPKTLRLMAQAKKIPARRVGKLWRFSEDRLREWLEAS